MLRGPPALGWVVPKWATGDLTSTIGRSDSPVGHPCPEWSCVTYRDLVP